MAEPFPAKMRRKHVERELFTARQILIHLVQLYESGQWRRRYKERIFVSMVRRSREAVEHWTTELDECGRSL